MKLILLTYSISMILLSVVVASAQKSKIQSVYTTLKTDLCKTLESETEGAGFYRGECPGIGGYKLQVIEGDLRQSIDLIAPNKDKFELDFIGHVSGGFSTVGEKAEWRVTKIGKKQTPIALIVRFNASENPADSSKTTTYLVVSKITKNQICITDIVKASAKQNEEAQKLADASASKPCKMQE